MTRIMRSCGISRPAPPSILHSGDIRLSAVKGTRCRLEFLASTHARFHKIFFCPRQERSLLVEAVSDFDGCWCGPTLGYIAAIMTSLLFHVPSILILPMPCQVLSCLSETPLQILLGGVTNLTEGG